MKRSYAPGGSILILFTVVMVCVSVLAVLCVSTARADLALAEKYGEYVAEISACENAAQRWLAEADARLAGGEAAENGEISALISEGGTRLSIRLRPLGDGEGRFEILEWARQSDWEREESLNVWQPSASEGEQ
ncbi:MAG: hypothetical protein Q4B42_06550 [Oscillospiraceae bacterium]|nr:hypothetical protein [Oscillospiraceae bacterium]